MINSHNFFVKKQQYNSPKVRNKMKSIQNQGKEENIPLSPSSNMTIIRNNPEITHPQLLNNLISDIKNHCHPEMEEKIKQVANRVKILEEKFSSFQSIEQVLSKVYFLKGEMKVDNFKEKFLQNKQEVSPERMMNIEPLAHEIKSEQTEFSLKIKSNSVHKETNQLAQTERRKNFEKQMNQFWKDLNSKTKSTMNMINNFKKEKGNWNISLQESQLRKRKQELKKQKIIKEQKKEKIQEIQFAQNLIDLDTPFIRNFDVQNNIITRNARNANCFVQVLLKTVMSSNKIFSFSVRVLKSKNNHIFIGVTDRLATKLCPSSWLSGQTICYHGWGGACLGENGKLKCEGGGKGFREGDLVKMQIDLNAGKVSWLVESQRGTDVFSVSSQILREKNRIFVPYCELGHMQDCVLWSK